MSAHPNDHVPLTPLAFHIVLALGAGARHGYDIGQEVERRSHGRSNPATGALYQALRRLTGEGLVERDEAAGHASPDARRQYFRLTDLGRRVAGWEAARLDELVGLAREQGLFPRPFVKAGRVGVPGSGRCSPPATSGGPATRMPG